MRHLRREGTDATRRNTLSQPFTWSRKEPKKKTEKKKGRQGKGVGCCGVLQEVWYGYGSLQRNAAQRSAVLCCAVLAVRLWDKVPVRWVLACESGSDMDNVMNRKKEQPTFQHLLSLHPHTHFSSRCYPTIIQPSTTHLFEYRNHNVPWI